MAALDTRTLLHRRVAIYLGVGLALWAGLFVVNVVIERAFDAPWRTYGIARIAHVTVIVVLAGLSALVRVAKQSEARLRAMDVGSTLVQAVALSSWMTNLPLTLRPHLTLLLALTNMLVLRAAIIPSHPRFVAAIGLLAYSPLAGMTTWAQLHRVGPAFPPARLEIVNIVVWSLVSLTGTVAISWVIYGLQKRALELGQYTLLEKIGAGGMGTVWRAKHALLRRPTAVKVLSGEQDRVTVARFEREVQLTSEIAHPNIVSVYDFGRAQSGAFYYAMEYLDGLDLQRLVDSDGPQPASRVVHVLLQAAEALGEAHAVGLIHRDVKPANLFLCENARRHDLLKVVDFGLVKEMDKGDPGTTSAGSITGTPLYMSPESITTPESIDARSDLYSLAAVGYFLLTGEPVFDGRTVVEVCAQHLHQAPARPSKRTSNPIPSSLEDLLMACLAKSPNDRSTNAAVFAASLRACHVPVWESDIAASWWKKRPRTERKRSEPQTLAVFGHIARS